MEREQYVKESSRELRGGATQSMPDPNLARERPYGTFARVWRTVRCGQLTPVIGFRGGSVQVLTGPTRVVPRQSSLSSLDETMGFFYL
ncbi:hypothetical protein ACI5FR_29690 [Paenibacillus sp. HJGM_3]